MAATAFVARRLREWLHGVKPTPLYLNDGLKADFAAPKSSDSAYEEYVSDPAKPVPYRARPIDGTTWRQWLVDDQREAIGPARCRGVCF